ncbi:MAG: hypothetical protein WAV93_07645 [Bacteroidales bacterium]
MGCIIVKSGSLTELSPDTMDLTLTGNSTASGTITRSSPGPALMTLA